MSYQLPGSGVPAAPDKSIQWNNVGAFGGSASLLYDDPTKEVQITNGSALPKILIANTTAATPDKIRLRLQSPEVSVYGFSAVPRLNLYAGGSGPAFPANGTAVGSINFRPVNDDQVAPTNVGGASINVTCTQTAQLGIGGGVGLTINTAANNQIVTTTRFLVSQTGCCVVGAEGQSITANYGTNTGVVLGQLTLYDNNAAIQIGNPSLVRDNKSVVIQATPSQTNAFLDMQDSTGAQIFLFGRFGTLTIKGLGSVPAVSAAAFLRLYADGSGRLNVSENAAAYGRVVITGGAAPTIAAGAGAGAGASASILSARNSGGQVRVTTGTGAGVGVLATVTFNATVPYTNAPAVVICAADADAAPLNVYVTNVTTTGFDLAVTSAPVDATAYDFSFICVPIGT